MRAGAVCIREVVIVQRGESIRTAAELMAFHHVGDVVVVEEKPTGRVPIGILTDRDIAVGVVAAGRDPVTTTAEDALADELITAREDDDLLDVLARMRGHAIRRIPVVNQAGVLEGIIALDDVLELVSHMLDDVAALIGRQRLREERARGGRPERDWELLRP